MTDKKPSYSFFKSFAELTDVASVLVHCTDDNSYMFVLESDSSDMWVPSETTGTVQDEWRSTAEKILKDLFQADITNAVLIKVYKIWQPDGKPYLLHVVFSVLFTLDQKRKRKVLATNKNRVKVRWLTDLEMSRVANRDSFKTPEVFDFIAIIRGSEIDQGAQRRVSGRAAMLGINSWSNVIGCSPLHILYEVLEKHVIVPIEKTSTVANLSAFEQLVHSAKFFQQEQIALYKEFLARSFPCMFLSRNNFSEIMTKIGWTKESIPGLFRSSDMCNRGALSFRDLLYGISATEPDTVHGGLPAELRCRCIFRFYDANSDGRMEYAEFKELVSALRKTKNLQGDQTTLDAETSSCAKAMGFEPNAKLNQQDFLRAVGELKFRGTSSLLRSPSSMRDYLADAAKSAPPDAKGDRGRSQDKNRAPPEKSKPSVAPTAATQGGKSAPKMYDNLYELAVHCVKLKKSGTIIDTDQLWDMDAAVSKSTNFGQKALIHRRQSQDQFDQKSLPNELLTGLKYFEQAITSSEANRRNQRKPKEAFTWGQVDPLGFAKCLIAVCEKTKDIIKTEPRLIEVPSPVFVLGDIHGNLADLLYFEKVLWRLGPSLSPASLLFLGDYVDRGPHGVEVVAYLFAHKVQAPKKMWLLRGNHEARSVQKLFTFYNECLFKFGEAVGKNVWEAVNTVFDVLPLAAVIDDKVFCCHGGIPPPWLCPVISAINSIPNPLPSPDTQSALAWDIMWNDPTRQTKPDNKLSLELLANDGFAFNSRRGTAHVFSSEALERFLLVNQLTYVVRAHEVALTGFQVQQRGKLVTVFSSSRYCGGANEAACVLADQQKLRIFRLETT